MKDMSDKINDLTELVIGVAIEVHRQLGPGFIESTYHRALEVELELRSVTFESEKPVSLTYKGHPIGEGRLDLLIDGQVIIELKAVDRLMPIHHAQVISYLKATNLQVGLLINFNVEVLRDGIKRIVLTHSTMPSSANSAPPR